MRRRRAALRRARRGAREQPTSFGRCRLQRGASAGGAQLSAAQRSKGSSAAPTWSAQMRALACFSRACLRALECYNLAERGLLFEVSILRTRAWDRSILRDGKDWTGRGRGPRPSSTTTGGGRMGRAGKEGEGRAARSSSARVWFLQRSRAFLGALHALKRFLGASNCCWKPL